MPPSPIRTDPATLANVRAVLEAAQRANHNNDCVLCGYEGLTPRGMEAPADVSDEEVERVADELAKVKAKVCTGCGEPRADHRRATDEEVEEMVPEEARREDDVWYKCANGALSRG